MAAAPIRLLSGVLTVGSWTLLSRVAGFVRDILIAAFLGTGPVSQAFIVAFSLPNMFRRFFAEGAFNMAFVPMFSKKVEAGEDAQAFAQDAFSGLATILIAFTLLALAAMPWLVLAMASGFAGDVRFDLSVVFGRIAFAYILLISLAALFSGVLNALGRFAAAAAAPVLLNVVLVAMLLLAESGLVAGARVGVGAGLQGLHHGTLLVCGVLAAGGAQLALVWVAAARAGIRLRPRLPRWTPDMRRLAVVAGPAMLAGGVVQVNLLVGRQVASYFDGAVVWLSFADRLYQLPLGVVGIAIGVVLLPALSRRLAAGDATGGQAALSRAGEVAMALTLPCTVALVVVPLPVVEVLFERGAFGADDTASTALALMVYALGLPAFVLQKILQPLYFAREDTASPFRYALVALVVNAVVAIGLAPVIGFVAAALGTSIAAWAMVALLLAGRGSIGQAGRFDARFRRRVWRIALASGLMGVVVWGLWVLLTPLLDLAAWRYAALAVLVAGGIGAYAGLAQALGGIRLSEMRAEMRGRG